ncbi:MAG: class I SAM-dependent methyltransferase [Mucilaginibacter sp.]
MNDQLTSKQKIFFRFFYRFRRRFWGHLFETEKIAIEASIPKIDLQPRNIRNLKSQASRTELLESMPKNAVTAEIGVDHGDFSELIKGITSPKKMHLIDAWADENRYHGGLKTLVEDKFKEEIANGKVELNVGFSTSVLPGFPDYYFDWVYLDTDHSYETTKAELAILKSKVKTGGIIAGHDYIIGNWITGQRYGVIEAVNEFCVNEDWEMIYLTVETDQYRSFAIKKIVSSIR